MHHTYPPPSLPPSHPPTLSHYQHTQGQFSRRLATDKCFICLFILVLLFVVVLVALKIFNDPGDNSSSTEDASLEFVDDDTA